MRSHLTRLAIGILFFIAAILVIRDITKPQSPLVISSHAWDFNLESIQGDSVRLSHSQGKVRWLVFWASWCTSCLKEIPTLIELQEELGSSGLQILSINLDENPRQVMPSILQRFRINYPILLGNSEVTKQYGGVQAIPTSFLIDGDGTIREVILGSRTADTLRKMILDLLKPAATNS